MVAALSPIPSPSRHPQAPSPNGRPHLRVVPTPAAPRRPVSALRPRVAPSTYRRRRVAAVMVVLASVVGAATAGETLGGFSLVAPERRPSTVRYVVQPGDSLWEVAQRVAPREDPRPVVDALVESRGDAPLLPGETIEWKR